MTVPTPVREPSVRAPDAGPPPEPGAGPQPAADRESREVPSEADLLAGAAASNQTHPRRGGIADPQDPAEAVAEDAEEAALLREQAARIGDGRASAGTIVLDPASHRRWLVAAGIAMAVLVGVFLVLG